MMAARVGIEAEAGVYGNEEDLESTMPWRRLRRVEEGCAEVAL